MNRLRKKYLNEVVPALLKDGSYTNTMAVPRLVKVVINLGLKDGAGDKGVVKKVAEWVSQIAGQKAIVTRAKKAEAAFKTRKNDPIGVMATLRGDRMYEFMDKLLSLVLPRVRDFSGVARTSFDGRGNYSLGFAEQIVFHEVDYDTIDTIRGLQVTIVTNAGNDAKAYRLLELLGMPWQK